MSIRHSIESMGEGKYANSERVVIVDSVQEFMEVAITAGDKINFREESEQWRGIAINHISEITEKFNTPYPEGVDRINAMTRAMEGAEMARPESTQRKRQWNDKEGEASAERIMDGSAEFFEAFKRNSKAQKATAITILINVGGSCQENEQSLFWKCAVMIAAMDIYEAAGYPCEAWAWFRTSGSYGSYRNNKTTGFFTAYKIKSFGDPVDVSTLSRSCAGWFFRTAGFGAICSAEDLPISEGYGRFVPRCDDRVSLLGIDDIEDCLTVSSSVRSEKDAIVALKQLIETGKRVTGEFGNKQDPYEEMGLVPKMEIPDFDFSQFEIPTQELPEIEDAQDEDNYTDENEAEDE